MLEEVLKYLGSRDPHELGRDSLDLLITYYIFYRIALVLKGTRAIQIVFGLAAVFVLYLVAQFLHLNTVLTLLSAVLQSAILIGVVVFQNDIRRGLIRVGARARLGTGQTLEAKVIDNVVEAATTLARHRTGAIITFEQDANLDEFVGSNTGQAIDAAVSPELLVSLFIPEAMNKLHDGAVVIRDLRIAKAGVFFPMPESKVADESFGSRHRAAMGITEETDAVVIVVSEERGSISFCFNGNIIPNLDGPKLRAALEAVFVKKRKKSAPKTQKPLWSRVLKRVTERPPPLLTSKKPARPAAEKEEVAPLRKKREPHSEEQPAPLRKRKDEPEEKVDSQRAPAPLRKKKSSEGKEPPRNSSNPPPAMPNSDPLRTPLRHMSPAASPDSSGPVTRSDPPRPMPSGARTPSIPPPPPPDLPDEPVPLSTRMVPGRPMPAAAQPMPTAAEPTNDADNSGARLKAGRQNGSDPGDAERDGSDA